MYVEFYITISIIMQLSAPLAYGSQYQSKIIENLVHFCQQNGKVSLVMTTFDENDPNVRLLINAAYKYAVKMETIPTRIIPTKLLIANSYSIFDLIDYEMEFLVLISSNYSAKSFEKYLDVLKETKVMSSILMFADPLTSDHLHSISEMLRNFVHSSSFFLLFEKTDGKNNNITWQEVITLQRYYHPVVRSLEFDRIGRMKANHDMQGIHIKCYTLPWAPYLTLSDCMEPNMTSCKSVGYLADVMENLGSMFNFTWDCDMDPNGDWGVLPISGPSNVSGNWGGVLGKVVSGEYQLCLSYWTHTANRIGMFDFIPLGKMLGFVLAYFPKAPSFDPLLFTRPFRYDAWLLSGATGAIFSAFCALSYLLLRDGKRFDTIRVLVFVCWITYVLMCAYFEGAMTMFFSTESSLIFKSMAEVIKAHPSWNFKIRSGNEMIFKQKAESGETDFVTFWKRLQNYPQTSIYDSIEDAIKEIQSEQTVIHLSDKTLRQYYLQNPQSLRPKTVFPEEQKGEIENMIVTNNSPLGPMLKYGCRVLLEKGVFDILDEKWMGKSVQYKSNASGAAAQVLSIGEVMAAFVILGVALILSLICLILEDVVNWLKGKENKKQRQNDIIRQKIIFDSGV